MAQSVPEATFIPCLDALPLGWELTDAESSDDRSVLKIENDAFDQHLAIELVPKCEIGEATKTVSTRPDTDVYTEDEGATTFHVFSGGCIRFAFETRNLARSPTGHAMTESISFMTRDSLRALSGWSL
jgi:hypothetical protein